MLSKAFSIMLKQWYTLREWGAKMNGVHPLSGDPCWLWISNHLQRYFKILKYSSCHIGRPTTAYAALQSLRRCNLRESSRQDMFQQWLSWDFHQSGLGQVDSLEFIHKHIWQVIVQMVTLILMLYHLLEHGSSTFSSFPFFQRENWRINI